MRLHHRWTLIPALLSLACTVPAETVPEAPATVAGGVMIGDPTHAFLPDLMDTVALAGPSDLAVIGDKVFIAEATGHQIAVFDTLLRFTGRFSRGGSGPGELETPLSLAATPEGELAVREQGNGRISVFRTDGVFRVQLPVMGINTQFAAVGDTRFVTGSMMAEGHALSLVEESGSSPFGQVLNASSAEAQFKPVVGLTGPGGEARIGTLEGSSTLQLLDTDGALVGEYPLPEEISERIEARRAEVSAAFGGGWTQSFKDVASDAAGRIWILLTLADPSLLLFDITEGKWTPISISERETTRYLVRNATSIAVIDDRLFVLTGEQIHVLPITRADRAP